MRVTDDGRFGLVNLTRVYGAADELDMAPFAELLADGVVMHLPGLSMELAGAQECVRALRMAYADLRIRQRPLRVERLGPFVVVLVTGSSSLRTTLESVHVMRLGGAERVVEFWGISTPMHVQGAT